MSEYDRHIFHEVCSYTGELRETFECGTGEVEADERLWLDDEQVGNPDKLESEE